MSEHHKSNEQKSWLELLGEVMLRDPQDREQLINMLREAKDNEILDAETLSMVESTVMLSEMRARDVLVPRTQVEFLKVDSSLETIIPILQRSEYSRFPVFDEDEEKVLGLLLVKDVLHVLFAKKEGNFDMHKMLRPAMFVPESKRLDALLREFRATRNHMAIVMDEYGAMDGLVTIEDVLEQIVGDIEDEHDVEREPDNIRSVEEGRYLVKALTPVEEFQAHFECQLPQGDFDTVGGLLLNHFGYLPKRNEKAVIGPFEFTILSANTRCVHLLEVLLV
jgi:magnesium and cobalt transporter